MKFDRTSPDPFDPHYGDPKHRAITDEERLWMADMGMGPRLDENYPRSLNKPPELLEQEEAA